MRDVFSSLQPHKKPISCLNFELVSCPAACFQVHHEIGVNHNTHSWPPRQTDVLRVPLRGQGSKEVVRYQEALPVLF